MSIRKFKACEINAIYGSYIINYTVIIVGIQLMFVDKSEVYQVEYCLGRIIEYSASSCVYSHMTRKWPHPQISYSRIILIGFMIRKNRIIIENERSMLTFNKLSGTSTIINLLY